MSRTDWLIAFLDAEPHGGWKHISPAQRSLDPIRIMKGVFLAEHEDEDGVIASLTEEPYEFRPYAYGPFTSTIYHDLDELSGDGLVEKIAISGQSYSRWRLTAAGAAAAALAKRRLGPAALARLRRAKTQVVFRGFRALLEYVYRRFPDYARESVVDIVRK